MKKIILASASPRRKELLEQINIQFDIKISHKEEVYTATKAEDVVKELALLKAMDVAEKHIEENTIIIGADTVVVSNHKILGKPKDTKEAFDMIEELQGSHHQVYTSIALVERIEGQAHILVNEAVHTTVFVNPMTQEEIGDYIAMGDSMDKAGAYGIQGPFAAYIERIEGDYYNVVGLPISTLYQYLKEYSSGS